MNNNLNNYSEIAEIVLNSEEDSFDFLLEDESFELPEGMIEIEPTPAPAPITTPEPKVEKKPKAEKKTPAPKAPAATKAPAKITTDSVEAFLKGEPFKRSNTIVDALTSDTGEKVFYLKAYGYIIAKRFSNGIEIGLPDTYNKTMTDRLNGIPGVNIQKDGKLITLNGNPWNGVKTLIPLA